MAKKKKVRVDRVSDLPIDILHRILCFLPQKTAAKTSLLSKRWRYAWDSCPVFDFRGYELLGDYRGNEAAIKRYTDIVDHRFYNFCKLNNYSSIHKVHFNIPCYNPNCGYPLETWMGLIIEKKVKELLFSGPSSLLFPQTVFAARSLIVLEIFGVTLQLNGVTINLPSLQSLSLCDLRDVYDTKIQHLISSCPSLQYLAIHHCRGLKQLNLSGLVKLLSVGVSSSKSTTVKLSDCQGLKRASFCRVKVECMFDDVNFPQIEDIELSDCIFLRGIKISSHQLKTLVLDEQDLDNHEIFAPSLSSVKRICLGHAHALTPLSKLDAQCKLKVEFDVDGGLFCTPWLIKLNKFLHLQNARTTLEITICQYEPYEFDREEALGCSSSSPPYAIAIEHLALYARELTDETCHLEIAAILDGFLWCCQPDILSLSVFASEDFTFLEFVCKILEKDMDDQVCCSSSSKMKCWRHSLKKVKDVTVNAIKGTKVKVPFCWRALSKAISGHGGRIDSVSFNLLWQNFN